MGLKKLAHNSSTNRNGTVSFETMLNYYKKYKNILTSVTRTSKDLYYQKILYQHRCNIKKTWNIINEIIRRNKSSQTLPNYFIHNGNIVQGSTHIANAFNKTYAEVGHSLASTIGSSDKSFDSHLGRSPPCSFFLYPTNDHEVLGIIRSLRNSAAGIDNISTKVLKHVAHIIIKPLTHLCNLSLSLGAVPKGLKSAKITPIFKVGSSCTRTILN